MITERQGEILKTLIKEYIRTAEPVSSGFLASKYDFGLCSSAIRIEMQNLIQMGYLEQPHTSAGRIPTDKAYRFFVDQMVEEIEKNKQKEMEKMVEEILTNHMEDTFRFAFNLSKALSEASSSFIFIHCPEKEISWKSGLDEIVRVPEFSNRDFVSDFLCLVDGFEERIVQLEPEQGIKIYIGEEVPESKSNNISIICSRVDSLNGGVDIALVGPRRMDYMENVALLKNLNNTIREFYEERKKQS
jgi:heat-inducible transcriptional repressor